LVAGSSQKQLLIKKRLLIHKEMLFMDAKKVKEYLDLGFTHEQVVQMLTKNPADQEPAVAMTLATGTEAVKGFKKHQASGAPCRLCEHPLGSTECCGLPAPKAVFLALEKAGVPRGPKRVAALKAAKKQQREDGHSGPVYSRKAIEAALAAANAE
jgi:hypothetical protein